MSVGQTNPLRQQMINLLYLVLMALLALNVSADILKAFALVNGSITKTNTIDKGKNASIMATFHKAYNDDPKRAALLYENAQKVQALGDSTYNYLESLKDYIASESGGWVDPKIKKTVVDDKDVEIASNYFVEHKKGAHGIELKKKLQDFQDGIRGLLIDANGQHDTGLVNISLDLKDQYVNKDGTKKNWREYYFEGVPAIAAITELTKFQGDVTQTVQSVNRALLQQIGAQAMKFDALIPVISSPTPAVYSGDKYEANISVGAISNTQQFEATVNGQAIPTVNGVAHFETGTSGIGEKTLNIDIKYKDQNGQWKDLTTTTKYNVFTGSATISATKMNMLYIGLDNPISVSVPGFRPDQIKVTATSGLNLKRDPKSRSATDFICTPGKRVSGGTITVTAEGHRVGSEKFRVRPVPKPEVLFGTRTGGAMSRGELMTVHDVQAGLGAAFAFEGLHYRVLRYTLVYAPRHGQAIFYPIQGNNIPGNVKSILNAAHSGDMILVTNVVVEGPGVPAATVSGPSITIQ